MQIPCKTSPCFLTYGKTDTKFVKCLKSCILMSRCQTEAKTKQNLKLDMHI